MDKMNLREEARIILESRIRTISIIYIVIALLIAFFLPNIIGKTITIFILCIMILLAISIIFRIDFEGLEDDIYKSLVDDYNYYLESLNELEKTLEAEAYAKINELKENIDQILEEHEEENLSAEDITKLLKERGFTDFEILTFNVDNSSTDLIDDNPEIFDEIEIDFDIEKEDKKEDDNDNSRP